MKYAIFSADPFTIDVWPRLYVNKLAKGSFFSSKANMFIKHFNIHQKIPLHIIQEFFLNES